MPIPQRPSPLAPPEEAVGARMSPELVGGSAVAIQRAAMSAVDTITHMGERNARFQDMMARAQRNQDLHAFGSKALVDIRTKADEVANGGDPATAEQRFNDAMNEVRASYKDKIADPQTYKMWDDNFSRTAALQGLEVRGVARKRSIDAGLATLDNNVSTYMDSAQRSKTKDERGAIVDQMTDAIDKAVSDGLLHPTTAEKMKRDNLRELDFVDARRLIQADPAKAMQVLGTTEFSNLDPKTRQALVESADAANEQRKRIAEAEARASRAELRQEATYAVQAIQDGTPYAGLNNLIKRAEAVDPKIASSLKLSAQNADWTRTLLKMSPQDIAAELERTKGQKASATDAELAANLENRMERGSHILQTVQRGMQADGLGWAEAQGVIGKTDLLRSIQAASGESDPTKRSQLIRDAVGARMAAVGKAREWYGRPDFPVLKQGEVDTIMRQFDTNTDPGARLDLLSNVTFGLGEEAGRAAMAQLRAAKLPDAAVYALDVAQDPARRNVARQLMGELTTSPANAKLTTEDLKTAKTKAVKVYQDGVGSVLDHAFQVTGNAGYFERKQTDLEALSHVTAIRSAGDISDPARTGYADMFGQLATLDHSQFAHVVYPSSIEKTSPGMVERGLTILREDSWKMLDGIRPKDKVAAREFETSVMTPLREAGTWVNAGDDFVLIVPGTGRPLIKPDGTLYRVSVQDALTAAKRTPEQNNNLDLPPLGP